MSDRPAARLDRLELGGGHRDGDRASFQYPPRPPLGTESSRRSAFEPPLRSKVVAARSFKLAIDRPAASAARAGSGRRVVGEPPAGGGGSRSSRGGRLSPRCRAPARRPLARRRSPRRARPARRKRRALDAEKSGRWEPVWRPGSGRDSIQPSLAARPSPPVWRAESCLRRSRRYGSWVEGNGGVARFAKPDLARGWDERARAFPPSGIGPPELGRQGSRREYRNLGVIVAASPTDGRRVGHCLVLDRPWPRGTPLLPALLWRP